MRGQTQNCRSRLHDCMIRFFKNWSLGGLILVLVETWVFVEGLLAIRELLFRLDGADLARDAG